MGVSGQDDGLKQSVIPHRIGVRARNGQFLPGRSGNPGGRPGGNEEFKRIRQLYRDRTETAVHEAERLMRESDDDRVRLAACQLITQRGWGKAPDAYSAETDPDERQSAIDWRLITPEQRAELRRWLDFLSTLPRVADGDRVEVLSAPSE